MAAGTIPFAYGMRKRDTLAAAQLAAERGEMVLIGNSGTAVIRNYDDTYSIISAGTSGYDIRAFGAVGDGTTNDRAACVAADEAAQLVGGGVTVGPGTYLLSTSYTFISPVTMLPGAVFTAPTAAISPTVAGDAGGVITSISLSGQTAMNTMSGVLLWGFVNSAGTLTLTLYRNLYNNLSKLVPVAQTTRSGSGVASITALYSSGITGTVTLVAGSTDNVASANTLTSTLSTVTFSGFVADRYKVFSPSINVAFSDGATDYVFPQWKGGVKAGDTDDTDALQWAASLAGTQYGSPAVSTGSLPYSYSRTIIVNKQFHCTGTIWMPTGDGVGFKLATNPTMAYATANTGVNCTILVMDGGALHNSTLFQATDIDFSDIWLTNAQENYGGLPLLNFTCNGHELNKNSNGITARYNTTSDFSTLRIRHCSNGFRAFNNNQCFYRNLFAESIKNTAGNKPFEWVSCGGCEVNVAWTELGGYSLNGMTFDSCGTMEINNLRLGSSSLHLRSYIYFAAGGYTNAVGGDIGKTVVGGTSSTTGTLVAYDNTAKVWTVDTVGTFTAGEAITITTGTGAGSLAASDHQAEVDWSVGIYLTNCSQMKLRHLDDTDVTYGVRKSYAVGSSSAVGADPTFNMVSDSYGKVYLLEDSNTVRGAVTQPMRLLDTSEKVPLRKLPKGSTLSVTITSLSGAISGAELDVYRLVGGSYTLAGTLSFSNITDAGNSDTQTLEIDTAALHSVVGSGGNGIITVEYSYDLVNGNAFA